MPLSNYDPLAEVDNESIVAEIQRRTESSGRLELPAAMDELRAVPDEEIVNEIRSRSVNQGLSDQRGFSGMLNQAQDQDRQNQAQGLAGLMQKPQLQPMPAGNASYQEAVRRGGLAELAGQLEKKAMFGQNSMDQMLALGEASKRADERNGLGPSWEGSTGVFETKDGKAKRVQGPLVEDPIFMEGMKKGAIGAGYDTASGLFGTGLKFAGNRINDFKFWDIQAIKDTVKPAGDYLIAKGEGIKEYFNALKKPYDLPESYNKKNWIDNPELLADPYWMGYQIGMTGSSIVPSAVAGLGAGGLIKVGGQLLKWTPQLVNRLARIGGVITGGSVGGSQEASQTYEELIKRGAPEPEAAASASVFGFASAALNAISLNSAISPFTAPAKKSILSYLRTGAVKGLKTGLTEAVTEYAEEPVEGLIMTATGRMTWPEFGEKVKEGVNVIPGSFLVGFAGGIGGGAITGIKEGPQQNKAVEDIRLAQIREAAQRSLPEFRGSIPPGVRLEQGPAGKDAGFLPEPAPGPGPIAPRPPIIPMGPQNIPYAPGPVVRGMGGPGTVQTTPAPGPPPIGPLVEEFSKYIIQAGPQGDTYLRMRDALSKHPEMTPDKLNDVFLTAYGQRPLTPSLPPPPQPPASAGPPLPVGAGEPSPQFAAPIAPTDKINGITREEVGKLAAEGQDITPHIEEAIAAGRDPLQVQDAVGNEIMGQALKHRKEPEVRKNLAEAGKQLNEVIERGAAATVTASPLPPEVLAKAVEWDKKHPIGATVTDVTPEGYGPTGEVTPPDETRLWADPDKIQKLKNTILEAETILKGKMPAAKRRMIEKTLALSKTKLAAVLNFEPGTGARSGEQTPAAVVTEAVQAAVKENVPLKAQKKYLIDNIDEAIKGAPEGKAVSHVKIEVPGDGVFSIWDDKLTLELFKKQVKSLFPSTNKVGASYSLPSIKRIGKPIPEIIKENDAEVEKYYQDRDALIEQYEVTKGEGVKRAEAEADKWEEIHNKVSEGKITLKSLKDEFHGKSPSGEDLRQRYLNARNAVGRTKQSVIDLKNEIESKYPSWGKEPIAEAKPTPGVQPNPNDKIIKAMESVPSGLLQKYEKEFIDKNTDFITIPRNERLSLENAFLAEISNYTGGLGGEVIGENKDLIGKAKFYVERPYGTLTYNEADGTLLATPPEPVSKMVAGESKNVNFGADTTLLLQTISKDIVNNNLGGTVANETIQNSLDAIAGNKGAKNIDINIDDRYSEDGEVRETVVTISDNGKGMSAKDVERNLLRLGAKGKEGDVSRGGYGLAKAGFILTARSVEVTTTKAGQTTVLKGTREQFFGIKGAGKAAISVRDALPGEIGTTFKLNFFAYDHEAKEKNAYALDRQYAQQEFNKYIDSGVKMDGVHITLTERGNLVRDVDLKAPKSMSQIHPSKKLDTSGNKFTIYFVPPTKKVERSWNGKYSPRVITLNKGLALFGISAGDYSIKGMETQPDFEVLVDFEKTPDVRDRDYPFIRNRTELNYEIRNAVAAEVNKVVDQINRSDYAMRTDDFKAMVQKSPTVNGVKILIPFKDAGEFSKAHDLIKENGELVGDLADIFGSFKALLDKAIGGKQIELTMTVDPYVHGFRSNPQVVGVELYAINPFAVTDSLRVSKIFAELTGEKGVDPSTYMASNLVHTLVHEYTHNKNQGHGEDFASALAEVYTRLSHGQLSRLENQSRSFYEKYGEQLSSLQKDFSSMGQGGSELGKDSLRVRRDQGIERPGDRGNVPAVQGVRPGGTGVEQYALTRLPAGQRLTPTVADVKKIALPGQEVRQMPDGRILAKTRGGKWLEIKFVDYIEPDRIALEIGYSRSTLKGTERIAGKYQGWDSGRGGTVELVKGLADNWTLAHEVDGHFLEDMGIINSGDVAALRGHIKRLVKNGEIKPRNPLDPGGKEDRANFIASELNTPTAKGFIKRIIDRIRDFLDRIVNAFGHKTARGVVSKIKSGKIFDRTAKGEPLRTPEYQKTASKFYSQMQDVLGRKLPNSGPADQMAKMVESFANKGEFKAAELKWSGLTDFLAEKKGKVTKAEVLDYLKANQVEVKEVVKQSKHGYPYEGNEWQSAIDRAEAEGNFDEAERIQRAWEGLDEETGSTAEQPKFSSYVLPGGENYREVLLTLPVKQAPKEVFGVMFTGKAWKITKDGEPMNMREFPTREAAEDTATTYNENDQRVQSEKNAFTGGHWSEPNVMAHLRLTERINAKGERVLFIEEIQSDWALEGRKKGYKDWTDKDQARWDELARKDNKTGEESDELATLNERKLSTAYGEPPFPFAKSWEELALKTALRYAAENGFDRLSWINGEETAKRYDLSKYLDTVKTWREAHISDSTFSVIGLKDGKEIITEANIPKEKLSDYIGKDFAEKVIQSKDNSNSWSALDLKVGGTWAYNFYDKQVPDFLRKYGKKWQTTIGEDTFKIPPDHLGEHSHTYTSIPITPAMRHAVVYQGQPQFAVEKGKSIKSGGVNPSVAEGRPDSPTINTKGIANFLEGQPFDKPESFGLLDVPSKLAVMDGVIAALHNDEVRNIVIKSIPVNMVNKFSGLKLSPKMSSHDKSMITDLLSVDRNVKIPIGSEVAGSLARIVARVTAIVGKTSMNMTGRTDNLFPTMRTGNFEFSGPELSKALLGTKGFPSDIGGLSDKVIPAEKTFDRGHIETSSISDENSIAKINAISQEKKPQYSIEDVPEDIQSLINSEEGQIDPQANLRAFRALIKKKGIIEGPLFSTKDISLLQSTFDIPWGVAKDFPEFKKFIYRQIQREGDRTQASTRFLESPTKKRAGEVHEFLNLSTKQSEDLFTKAIVPSGAFYNKTTGESGRIMPSAELDKLGLSEAQKAAYYAWDRTMKNAWKFLTDHAEGFLARPYEGTDFHQDLLAVIREEKTPEEALAAYQGTKPEEFAAAIDATVEHRSKLKELRAEIGKVKFYVPRVREQGDYVVRVYNSKGHLLHSERTTATTLGQWKEKREAEKIARRLEKQYPDTTIKMDLEQRTSEDVFQRLNDIAMERFIISAGEKLRKGGDASPVVEEARKATLDALIESVADELKARGFARHAIHRIKGTAVPGYKTEGGKEIFYNYITGMTGIVTKQDFAFDVYQMMAKLASGKKKMPERIFNYTQQYVENMLRNTTAVDLLSGKLRNLAFGYYLAANLKSATVNFAQNYIAAIPELAGYLKLEGKNGILKAERIYHKAMLDVIRKHYTAEESKAIENLHDRGFTQDQFVREAQGKVGTSLIAHGWGKVIHWASIPFSAVETFNRQSAGLAMFRTARKQGLSYEESLKKAEDFIYNTHYLMGKANMPLFATAKGLPASAARTALTFRMYNYNYIRQMITAARKNPEGKRQWNTIGRSLAYIALFGGVLSWPWIDDILDILERMTGNPYRLNLKKMLKRRAGEAGSLIALHGLPGLVNVDLSGSLKMGLPYIPYLTGGSATDISGVYSGMAKKAGQSVHSLATGQPLRALEQAAPAAIENPLKGLRGYAEGMTSNWGKTMYGAKGEPLRMTGWEALKQSAGYRSARMADEAMQKRVSSNVKSHFDGERKGIYEKYRIADRKRDQDAMKRLDRKINQFNSRAEKYGGVIPFITEESLVGVLEEHPDKRITVD